jgi:protein gp37
MAETTAIEWARATWSPWEGCQKAGPGCDHCYAESMNRWLRKGENWGPGAPRREYSDKHWEKPLKWNDQAAAAGEQWRVFPSVCDPFDKAAPDGARDRFWLVVEATPNLTWLLLTKRIGNVLNMVPPSWLKPGGWPSNVWLGATIVNQEEADRDIPKLLATPATVRFLSMEPLLGPVDLSAALKPWPGYCQVCGAGLTPRDATSCDACGSADHDEGYAVRRVLRPNWVIVGGESGHKARPMHPDWARGLRNQCEAAGVPFLFKQWGEWIPAGQPYPGQGDGEWAPIREFGYDEEGRTRLHRIGKKAAGRLLDGVEWNQFPEASCAT